MTDQQSIMTKSQDNKAVDDPVTPIIVAKNELRLVKTEQRLDRTEQVKKEGHDLDASNRKISTQKDMVEESDENSINMELNKHLQAERASQILLNAKESHAEAQSPTTPIATLPMGIAHQAGEKSAECQKEENDCDNQLDDLNIQDALIPTGDLNTESLETSSCEEEAECEQDSQSIDLSVSPIKNREDAANQSQSFDKEAREQSSQVQSDSEKKRCAE